METPVYIYILKDPDTNAVHWVGRTVDPDGRFSHHLWDRRGKKGQWIKALKAQGKQPVMELVEECSEEDSVDMETTIIHEYLQEGAPLLNRRRQGSVSRSKPGPSKKTILKNQNAVLSETKEEKPPVKVLPKSRKNHTKGPSLKVIMKNQYPWLDF